MIRTLAVCNATEQPRRSSLRIDNPHATFSPIRARAYLYIRSCKCPNYLVHEPRAYVNQQVESGFKKAHLLPSHTHAAFTMSDATAAHEHTTAMPQDSCDWKLAGAATNSSGSVEIWVLERHNQGRYSCNAKQARAGHSIVTDWARLSILSPNPLSSWCALLLPSFPLVGTRI